MTNLQKLRRLSVRWQFSTTCVVVLSMLHAGAGVVTSAETNYDQDKVPVYTLPDPLRFADGTEVNTAAAWKTRRRAEVIELFREHVYGRTPERAIEMSSSTVAVDHQALNNTAIRKEVTLHFTSGDRRLRMDLLMYLPKTGDGDRPSPAFLGLNFNGNHTVSPDPEIRLSQSWIRDRGAGVVDHRATEAARGTSRGRWAIEKMVQRGYALVTAYYGDIDPDFDDGFQNGIHPLFYAEGQSKPAPNEWGSIAAWAWGLSRALDYLESDSAIDATRVAVMGHSRLGKTALWAGAQDERFALVISNNSGCGGAALNRRQFGETVERINNSFPHWFCDNFTKFNGREDESPVDQHMLIALVAPRPVLVCSAEQDRWADPRGEFLSALHAAPVYRLLGEEGIDVEEMPRPNQPVGGTVGYHIRPGKHDVLDADWDVYMDFADRHLKKSN